MCKHCDKPTKNPKFCSRSCAAQFNNKFIPKRKLEGHCQSCKLSISSGRTYCKECWILFYNDRNIEAWENKTLQEAKGFGNANSGGRYPYIRTLSRKKYLRSNLPKQCFVCGYDKHFDVCHVKDIKTYSENTLIKEINSFDNLIALCKNHHWEFDHGELQI